MLGSFRYWTTKVLLVAQLMCVGAVLPACATSSGNKSTATSSAKANARKNKNFNKTGPKKNYSLEASARSQRDLDRRLLQRGRRTQFAPAFESY